MAEERRDNREREESGDDPPPRHKKTSEDQRTQGDHSVVAQNMDPTQRETGAEGIDPRPTYYRADQGAMYPSHDGDCTECSYFHHHLSRMAFPQIGFEG